MPNKAMLIFVTACTLSLAVNAAGTFLPAAEIAKLNTASLTNFNTRCLPQSLGLDVNVYYPECMKFERGGFQPHTVGKASYEWNGYDIMVMVQARVHNPGKNAVDILRLVIPQMTKNDIKEMFSADGVQFLNGGVTQIRTANVLWCDVSSKVIRMGETSSMVMRHYMIPANDGKIFSLQISVGHAGDTPPLNDFKALKPMIGKCAIALTLVQFSQFED